MRTKGREVKKGEMEIKELNTKIQELNERHIEMEGRIISQRSEMDQYVQLSEENELDRTTESQ